MSSINRILSGVAGQIAPLPAAGISAQPTAPVAGVQREAAGDIFTRGQWWRNRATGDGAGGNTRYGSAAYRATDKAGKDPAAGHLPESAAESTSSGGEEPEASGETFPGQVTRNPEDGEAKAEGTSPTSGRKADGTPLTEAEMQEIIQLAAADTEVRAHEMAHLSAAGPYALSGANYQFQHGPDGKQYAVAGEVSIDTSEENTPQSTINKMQTVRAAALAPASPSSQDRRVAASATAKVGVARQELNIEQLQELELQRREATNSSDDKAPAGVSASATEPKSPGQPGQGEDLKGVEASGEKTVPVSSPPPRIRGYSAAPSPISSPRLNLFL